MARDLLPCREDIRADQAAGDCDRDGTVDNLWRHIVAGDLWAWLMDGAVKVSEHYVGTVANQGYQVVR